MARKQALTAPAFREMAGSSVVDLGCGDIEFGRNEAFGDYLGLDLSAEAIATAKSKRPDWTFRTDPIETVGNESFDYALCMDVLIHQPNSASAEKLVENLLRVARKGVVLSIHSDPATNSGISFNTFDLRTFLERHPAVRSVVPLGAFRDTDILAVGKAPGVFVGV